MYPNIKCDRSRSDCRDKIFLNIAPIFNQQYIYGLRPGTTRIKNLFLNKIILSISLKACCYHCAKNDLIIGENTENCVNLFRLKEIIKSELSTGYWP